MELVRTHDAMDLVPPAIRVELGDGRPEAGDLQHHLGTIGLQEGLVAGGLVVLPDIPGDGRVHVALAVGAVADLVIFDEDEEWTIDPAQFRSKGRNTPFAGRKVKGKVKYTISGGTIIYQEG